MAFLLFYFFILLKLLIISVLLGVFFIVQIIAVFTVDAPFVPVPAETENEIIEHLQLQNGSVLYDLGCGDARILTKAIKMHPHIRCVGIEKAFFPYLIARFKTRDNNRIHIKREDIFSTPMSDATHVFMYLWPGVPDKLLLILEKKCRPGTRIISCDFECADRIPTEIVPLVHTGPTRGKKLYVYTL